jgi:hypothetical protein
MSNDIYDTRRTNTDWEADCLDAQLGSFADQTAKPRDFGIAETSRAQLTGKNRTRLRERGLAFGENEISDRLYSDQSDSYIESNTRPQFQRPVMNAVNLRDYLKTKESNLINNLRNKNYI